MTSTAFHNVLASWARSLQLPPWSQLLMTQIWQVTLLIVIVALACRLVSRRSPHWAMMLWLVVLAKCLTPPIIASPISVVTWISNLAGPANQGDRSISKAVNPASDLASDKLPTKTIHVPIEDPRFKIEVSDTVQTNKLAQGGWLTTLNGCVLATWVAGSIVMCGYVIIRWRKVLQIAARASASDASRWQQTVDQLRTRLKVWQTIKVVVSPDSFGPAVIGFIRPTIILPQSICERRRNELTPILMHEVLHVRRLDLWVGLLQTLCLIVYWFHPLVWWAMRRVNQEIERACDDELLATKQIEPITYAEHLLEILELKTGWSSVPTVPGIRSVEVTESRLRRILMPGIRRSNGTSIWCRLMMLAACLLILPGQPAAQTNQQKGTEETKNLPFVYAASTVPPAARLPPSRANAKVNVLADDSLWIKVYRTDHLKIRGDRKACEKLLADLRKHVQKTDTNPLTKIELIESLVVVRGTNSVHHQVSEYITKNSASTVKIRLMVADPGAIPVDQLIGKTDVQVAEKLEADKSAKVYARPTIVTKLDLPATFTMGQHVPILVADAIKSHPSEPVELARGNHERGTTIGLDSKADTKTSATSLMQVQYAKATGISVKVVPRKVDGELVLDIEYEARTSPNLQGVQQVGFRSTSSQTTQAAIEVRTGSVGFNNLALPTSLVDQETGSADSKTRNNGVLLAWCEPTASFDPESCILITDHQLGEMTKKTYSVGDLLLPMGLSKEQQELLPNQLATLCKSMLTTSDSQKVDAQIGPNQTLMISASDKHQTRVAELLKLMRRAMNLQLVIETRIIEGFNASGLTSDHQADAMTPRLLSEAEFAKLAQEISVDKRAVTVSAPKVTAFSGQSVTISTNLGGNPSSPDAGALLELGLCGRVESTDAIRLDMNLKTNKQPLADCRDYRVPTNCWLLIPATNAKRIHTNQNDKRAASDQTFVLLHAKVIEEAEVEMKAESDVHSRAIINNATKR